jgi:hypothetical protein
MNELRLGKLSVEVALLLERVSKLNPCHNPKGPGGGRFCDAKSPHWPGKKPAVGAKPSGETPAAKPSDKVRDHAKQGTFTIQREYAAEGDAWGKKLSSGERKALDLYTGDGFERINNTLRQQGGVGAGIKGSVNSLDSAIAKNTLAQDTFVYRGVSKKVLAGAKPGAVITDKGYPSTSLDFSAAAHFAGIAEGGGVVTRIRVPKGRKAGAVDGLNKKYPDENEVLLPRGTRFKVVGKSKVSGAGGLRRTVIDLEVI